MKRSARLLLFAALLVGACHSSAPDAPAVEEGYDRYGEAVTTEGAVPVQAVVAEPAPYLGQPVKIEGTVHEVCQMAGCWLTLDTGDATGVRISVPHNEDGSYAFTVPRDISGRRVVVQGTLEQGELSAEMQQHLAEDAGKPAAANLQPRTELRLNATGVLVQKA